MTYTTVNEAKATFDDLYKSPTPHNYLSAMAQHGYAIGEEAKPYFESAIGLLQEENKDEKPVNMLDLGCSYGVGAALVKHQLSFFDMQDFFIHRAPRDHEKCIASTRRWLKERDTRADITCVGVDSSEPAIRFATESGLLDAGIARNFEEGDEATPEEIALIENCDLLASTGAIGYVGEKTLSVLLSHLGKARENRRGPYAVVTILRMFDPEPIRESFKKFGFEFGIVSSIHLRQRRFTDQAEQNETVAHLEARGVSPAGLEEEGVLFADLYVAAPPQYFTTFRRRIGQTRICRSAHPGSGDGAAHS